VRVVSEVSPKNPTISWDHL